MTDPAQQAWAHVRSRSAGTPTPAGLLDGAPITVHFHPDRLLADGRTVAERLAADGRYRSQFETGVSNGGLTAHPGGDRDRWEHRLFGGAYTGTVTGRPVYGGLNLARHADGASPRFGSCHLVLAPHVTARTTFSHGDSVAEPSVVGAADTFGGIWAALRDEVSHTGTALGLAAADPDAWAAALTVPRTAPGRALDDYVEAQVHGGIDLAVDVVAVVADPAFRDTAAGELLARLAPTLDWHPGYVLHPAEFPADLRGPHVPPLAQELADMCRTDRIDAAVLGRAAQHACRDPERLQHLKHLWHILVLRGRPAP